MLGSLKGPLSGNSKFVAKLARVMSMLSDTNSLHDASTVGGHFIEFVVAGINASSLEALQQTLKTGLHLIVGSGCKVDRLQTLLVSELVVGSLNVVFLRNLLADVLIHYLVFLCNVLTVAGLAMCPSRVFAIILLDSG